MLVPIIIEGKEQRQHPCSRLTKGAIEKGWPEKATSDSKQLAEWSARYPGAVPGVVTENFTVLDVDDLQWLSANESRLGTTRVHFTARGRHYLFKPVAGLRSSTKKIAGVDIKTGPRNYVIYWPSLGWRVIDAPLAPFPESILDQLLAATSSAPVPSPAGGVAVLGKERECLHLVGRANEPLAPTNGRHSPAGKTINFRRRLDRILRIVEHAQPGTRNNSLFWATHTLRDTLIAEGRLAPEIAVQLLISAATVCGLVRDEGIRSVLATIQSGLKPRNVA